MLDGRGSIPSVAESAETAESVGRTSRLKPKIGVAGDAWCAGATTQRFGLTRIGKSNQREGGSRLWGAGSGKKGSSGGKELTRMFGPDKI